jgi:K+-transporting ATPase A subunit
MQLVVLIAALAISTPLLGGYMARVYDPSLGRPLGDRFFSAIERPIYRVCGIDPEGERRWTTYAFSVLAFSLMSLLILYAQLRLQGARQSQADGGRRQPADDVDASGRQHGGQGGPLRAGRLRHLRGVDHGYVHRRRQLRP